MRSYLVVSTCSLCRTERLVVLCTKVHEFCIHPRVIGLGVVLCRRKCQRARPGNNRTQIEKQPDGPQVVPCTKKLATSTDLSYQSALTACSVAMLSILQRSKQKKKKATWGPSGCSAPDLDLRDNLTAMKARTGPEKKPTPVTTAAVQKG